MKSIFFIIVSTVVNLAILIFIVLDYSYCSYYFIAWEHIYFLIAKRPKIMSDFFAASSSPTTIAPISRWGHTMTSISDTGMLLFGGQGKDQELCRDVAWRLQIGLDLVLDYKFTWNCSN